ncbi:MAG: thiamine diphosphokinase [Firmicutes bacterium]|nr:thiamine diphosphokinase [Bacillota bacterium]
MNLKKNKRVLLLGTGEDIPPKCPCPGDDFLLICADGGADLALKWNLRPDLIIGDQDSLSTQSLQYWQGEGVPVQKHPTQKDKTDLELAVDFALGLDPLSLTLAGAWGNRIDHSLGNLEILYNLARLGVSNELVTSGNRLIAFQKEYRGEVKTGSTVSLLPLSTKAEGVYTEGLFYSLADSTLVRGTTLGISNRALEDKIYIRLSRGVLLVVLGQ